VWCGRQGEFVRRAGFALLASLALHDQTSSDTPFLGAMKLIRKASTDDRNFVKKGVNWALRSVGQRSAVLHAAAISLAQDLAREEAATPRWIGRDALRDLNRPLVRKRVAEKDRKRTAKAKS
jgi:3-methyladenine DNA glycosylase AlkD